MKELVLELAKHLDFTLMSESEIKNKLDLFSAERKLGREERERIEAELFGWGPIEEAIKDENVTEIMVNAADSIWIERTKGLEKVEDEFYFFEQTENKIRKLLAKIGRKVDQRTPIADGRLEDGARICVVGAPAVRDGLKFSIRKFPSRAFSLEDLKEKHAFTTDVYLLLKKLILERKNILVAGGTGSGKTTMLNALASAVPLNERILTLEDTRELKVQHSNVIAFEAKPANLEGEGEVSLDQLVRTALRMRPDRIILGECRGQEVFHLLQALNTGHNGSMATVHANSARDALLRLETLALLHANNINPGSIRRYICSAIDVILFMQKKNGSRVLEGAFELKGIEGEVYLLRPLIFASDS